MKWSDVTAVPEYQSASPEDKERIRNAYFDQVILPAIPKGADVSQFRSAFDSEIPPMFAEQPSIGGFIKDSASRLGNHVVDSVSAAAKSGFGLKDIGQTLDPLFKKNFGDLDSSEKVQNIRNESDRIGRFADAEDLRLEAEAKVTPLAFKDGGKPIVGRNKARETQSQLDKLGSAYNAAAWSESASSIGTPMLSKEERLAAIENAKELGITPVEFESDQRAAEGRARSNLSRAIESFNIQMGAGAQGFGAMAAENLDMTELGGQLLGSGGADLAKAQKIALGEEDWATSAFGQGMEQGLIGGIAVLYAPLRAAYLAGIGASSGGTDYIEKRQAGVSVEASSASALAHTAAEILPEMFGFKIADKFMRGYAALSPAAKYAVVKRAAVGAGIFVGSGAEEYAEEAITELANNMTDIAVGTIAKSGDEKYLEQLRNKGALDNVNKAGLSGMIGAGPMAIATTAGAVVQGSQIDQAAGRINQLNNYDQLQYLNDDALGNVLSNATQLNEVRPGAVDTAKIQAEVDRRRQAKADQAEQALVMNRDNMSLEEAMAAAWAASDTPLTVQAGPAIDASMLTKEQLESQGQAYELGSKADQPMRTVPQNELIRYYDLLKNPSALPMDSAFIQDVERNLPNETVDLLKRSVTGAFSLDFNERRKLAETLYPKPNFKALSDEALTFLSNNRDDATEAEVKAIDAELQRRKLVDPAAQTSATPTATSGATTDAGGVTYSGEVTGPQIYQNQSGTISIQLQPGEQGEIIRQTFKGMGIVARRTTNSDAATVLTVSAPMETVQQVVQQSAPVTSSEQNTEVGQGFADIDADMYQAIAGVAFEAQNDPVVSALNQSVNRYQVSRGQPELTIREVSGDALRNLPIAPVLEAAKRVAEAFGKRIVVIEDASGKPLFFDGSYQEQIDPNTIFLDARSKVDLHRVTSHEILHALRVQAPDVYKVLEAGLRPLIDKKQGAQHLVDKGYGDQATIDQDLQDNAGDMQEELVADVFGDVLMDTEALDQLLGSMKPAEAKTFLQKAKEILDRAIAALKGTKLGAENYANLVKARSHVHAAAKEYMRLVDAGLVSSAPGSSDGKFSQKTAVSATKDDTRGLIVGAKPGEFGWSFDKSGVTPSPYSIAPVKVPNQEQLGQHVAKIFAQKGAKDFIAQHFGITKQSALGYKTIVQVDTRAKANFADDGAYDNEISRLRQTNAGTGDTESPAGPSDLFRRAADYFILPYARAVAGEGYRFSPELYGQRFGLTDQEVAYLREGLFPKSGNALSTEQIVDGKESLNVARTKRGNKASVNDVLWALQNRAARVGQIDPYDRSPRAIKTLAQAIANEVIFHIKHAKKSAIGWYDAALKEAKGLYASVFPELATDRDKEMVFDAVLGITSQGADVHTNSQNAVKLYREIRSANTAGEMVSALREATAKYSGSFGKQTGAIETNLEKLASLLEKNGYDKMRKLFNHKMTVGEWNAKLRNDPSLSWAGLKVKGQAGQKVTGWMVFGPKIGSFINNLHGDYSTLTADLWFTRTWNRLLGFSFVHTPLAENDAYQKFRTAILEDDMAPEGDEVDLNQEARGQVARRLDGHMYDVINDPDRLLSLAYDLEAEFRDGGYKQGSQAMRAAKRWVELRESAEAAPRNDTERDMQQRTVEAAQRIIKARTGKKVEVADIQAALWFHEKDLFGMFGATTGKSKPADYVDAAKTAVEALPKFSRKDEVSFGDFKELPDEVSKKLTSSWVTQINNLGDDLYRYPRSQASDIETVAREVSLGKVTVSDVSSWFDNKPDETLYRLEITEPTSIGVDATRDAFVTVKGDAVWINVASYKPGKAGSLIYSIVGNYAFNNPGMVFVGDPAGLSDTAVPRRLANMASLATKFGTTEFIKPHQKQMDKLKPYGFAWKTGDDQFNLAHLLYTLYNKTVEQVPEIAGVTYDKQADRFSISDEQFAELAARARADGEGAPGPGTLKVASAIGQILRDSGDQGALADGRQVRALDGDNAVRPGNARLADTSPAKRPMYSRKQTETPEFKRWFGDSKVVDAEGKPLVVYHGTRSDFSEFTDEEAPYRGGILAFFSSSKGFSNDYAGDSEGSNVIPAYLKIESPFDYRVDGEAMAENFLSETGGLSDQMEIQRILIGLGKLDEINLDADESLSEEDFVRAVSEGNWDALEAPEFVEFIRDAGYDGIITNENGAINYAVFSPTQIKSAIGNNGEFDGSNPDIRFSRKNGGTFDEPTESLLDNFIYKIQNRHIDTKRVVEAIKDAGQQVRDWANPYLQEELYHGRVATRVNGFLDDELRPLMKDMLLRKVTMADLEEYLHARHAKEANAHIAAINPALPDGGSGMTDAEVDDYFNNIDQQKLNHLEALAPKVDAMIAKTRAMTVGYQLESQSTVDRWANTYQYYVPLHREDMDAGPGVGQGFSVKGPAAKRRTGSTKKVVDILGNIAMQRERTIVRGEKNRVALAIFALAKMNPNPDFWKADIIPTKKVVNVRTGLVETIDEHNYKQKDNAIVTRLIDPKTGEVVEHFVLFNDYDERALRMARALKNLDMDAIGGWLGGMGMITRYFASVNTQYNPVFGLLNFTRDVQGAMLNLSSTPLKGKQLEVAKHVLPALRGIYIDLRDVRNGKHPTSSWAQLWEEFRNEGGQTGYRDAYATSKEREEALTKEMKAMAAGKLKNAAQAKAVFEWLSDYNEAIENAIRLSTYKTGLDNGLSKQQAASIAKNLTTNFNRKGKDGIQMGMAYAFFNASVQGTARLAETLTSPAGKRITAGLLTLGVVQALAMFAAGFGDDDPPEFVRERNIIIPLFNEDKGYISIPMPLGFHVIPNIGRVLTEWSLSGFKKTGDRFVDLALTLAGAFDPLGGGGSVGAWLTPTVFDPIFALYSNRDWTGRKIAQEDYSSNKPTPGYTRSKDTATTVSKTAAYYINLGSGGTDYTAGMFSPTPDQIDYLIGQVTGGVGRELSKVDQVATSIATGEDLPLYKRPIVGRFYGEASGKSFEANAYYNNIRKFSDLELEIKGRRENGESTAEFRKENPEVKYISLVKSTESEIRKLNKQRRDLIEKGASRDRVKLIEERITQRMKQLNDRVGRE